MSHRVDVADLRPGDLVELREDHYPDVVVRGGLHEEGASLCLGRFLIRDNYGTKGGSWNLTVVSRAPRRCYVNHPRTEPAAGDVVREDGTDRACTWVYEDPSDADEPWRHILGQLCGTHQVRWTRPSQMPKRLRLLVDGETGRCVP